MKKVYVKLTDKFIYTYSNNKLTTYESKYITNSSVNDIPGLIRYLKSILKENTIKRKYVFILNNLLNTSELFTYKHIIEACGIIYYQIVQDKDLLTNNLTNEYIVLFSWLNHTSMMYKLNNHIIVEPLNNKLIDKLKKRYVLFIGDTKITKKVRLPILTSEHYELNIFNYI